MELDKLEVHPEELKGIQTGEVKRFDFDQGTTLPRVALLQTPSKDYEVIGERISQGEMGGRIVASYRIQKVSEPV